MEKISIRLEDMIEAIREIAESVEDGSWNGLSQRVEDTLFPKNTPVSEKETMPWIGHCTECAYYLDYKDDWQCNGGVISAACKCHPEIPKDSVEEVPVQHNRRNHL